LSVWGTKSSVLKWRMSFLVYLLTLRSPCIMSKFVWKGLISRDGSIVLKPVFRAAVTPKSYNRIMLITKSGFVPL
jgi:hypothetical protein